MRYIEDNKRKSMEVFIDKIHLFEQLETDDLYNTFYSILINNLKSNKQNYNTDSSNAKFQLKLIMDEINRELILTDIATRNENWELNFQRAIEDLIELKISLIDILKDRINSCLKFNCFLGQPLIILLSICIYCLNKTINEYTNLNSIGGVQKQLRLKEIRKIIYIFHISQFSMSYLPEFPYELNKNEKEEKVFLFDEYFSDSQENKNKGQSIFNLFKKFELRKNKILQSTKYYY